jgi:1,4-dihydroxy-2-naphthoate octaprenyltransferase
VTQCGLIAPEAVRRAVQVTLGAAALVGLYLVAVGGWPVAAIGLAAIAAALAYSGGPFPLASHALGDLFVFLFFGPVAVGGSYWVQALDITAEALAMSVPVGLLVTAILVVNNLRDIPTDRTAGKRTLAVVLGEKGTRREFALLVIAAYAVPTVWFLTVPGKLPGLVFLATLPLAAARVRDVRTRRGRDLNPVLASTALLSLVFSLFLCAGILLAGGP